ncbi:uncharacterized protein B0P05DRAFT_547726 [Gilbertella persicaria]|uniref:uncharacterized protein n=1 Tax=Gilbertella persicaria TaxID=101096 RepID=UPI00221FF882|nr:uncharacterized protein B0P05DRAFT_547726 [Gilbertella persicaria]KAI8074212.1 hypothetical protein B0P05DRAFT_547726 [Gilbertella persicaria]
MLLFNCSKCQQQLQNPITLSCGYTVCMACLPSQSANQRSTFVCPVQQCKKESHLFGPCLSLDDIVDNLAKQNLLQPEHTQETHENATRLLQCSIGNHILQSPTTNHCGHTFCKLCLLHYKISNDQCKQCQKRLPSYQYIQQQPYNFLLESMLATLNASLKESVVTSNHVVSFSNLNKTEYESLPVYLSEFPVLPSQKLRIPIYTEEHRAVFLNSLLRCEEYQSLCLAMMNKDKLDYQGRFGTIVKITGLEQRNRDMIVDLIGLDRFQVTDIKQQADNFMIADIDIKFEAQEDLAPLLSPTRHWTEYALPQTKLSQQQLPPSPQHSMEVILNQVSPPMSPPIYDTMTPAIKLSNRVHEFISALAHSTPSKSFCSAIEGLLGPVWLESVQSLHGPLPDADNAVAMCWWTATVLPVSNADRYHLLASSTLEKRLEIILSWIGDLESQWGNCKRTAMNSAAKVWQ